MLPHGIFSTGNSGLQITRNLLSLCTGSAPQIFPEFSASPDRMAHRNRSGRPSLLSQSAFAVPPQSAADFFARLSAVPGRNRSDRPGQRSARNPPAVPHSADLPSPGQWRRNHGRRFSLCCAPGHDHHHGLLCCDPTCRSGHSYLPFFRRIRLRKRRNRKSRCLDSRRLMFLHSAFTCSVISTGL